MKYKKGHLISDRAMPRGDSRGKKITTQVEQSKDFPAFMYVLQSFEFKDYIVYVSTHEMYCLFKGS